MTYTVHIRVADLFEDITLTASSELAAIEAAREVTTLPARLIRWASFTV
jgi:hypothetical protein